LAEWFLVGSADSKRLLVRMDRQVMPSIGKMAGRGGNDPSVDIAKDADQRF
jgi:hypothetical protein